MGNCGKCRSANGGCLAILGDNNEARSCYERLLLEKARVVVLILLEARKTTTLNKLELKLNYNSLNKLNIAHNEQKLEKLLTSEDYPNTS